MPIYEDMKGVRLRILNAEAGTPKEVKIKAFPFTLGRDVSADLGILDEKLSRHHARLELRDGQLWFVDLNSTNGSFSAADLPITEVPLRASATRLRIGRTWIEVHAPLQNLQSEADLLDRLIEKLSSPRRNLLLGYLLCQLLVLHFEQTVVWTLLLPVFLAISFIGMCLPLSSLQYALARLAGRRQKFTIFVTLHFLITALTCWAGIFIVHLYVLGLLPKAVTNNAHLPQMTLAVFGLLLALRMIWGARRWVFKATATGALVVIAISGVFGLLNPDESPLFLVLKKQSSLPFRLPAAAQPTNETEASESDPLPQ